MKLEEYDGYMNFKCFNNKDIPIIGQLQTELNSGCWTARNCNFLVVQHKSQILAKLGLTLTQKESENGKKILNINENNIEQNITKWILKNYPHLCIKLGRVKTTLRRLF